MNLSSARQLSELGSALLDAGVSVTDVTQSLERAAARHQAGNLEFSVLSELVIVSEAESGASVLVKAKKDELTFAQAAAVNRLARKVETGTVPLSEIVGRVAAIRAKKRSHPGVKWTLGSALISLGLVVLFRCPWWAIVLSPFAGAVVGVLTQLLGRVSGANAIVPFVTAFVSTLLIGTTAAALGFGSVPLFAVCAPVAILVPGALITNALLELTASDIVTGASRLMYGIIMLGFMAAGIAAGTALTGLHVNPQSAALVGDIVDASALGPGWQQLPPIWFSWVGVVLLALSVGLSFGSGRALTLVNVVMMTGAYAMVTVLTPLVGNATSVGITAACLFVAGRIIEQFTLAIPATVSFQPAFLLLVPGTVGLVALTSFEPASLIAALLTFASLCIGTKVGDVLSELLVTPRSPGNTQGTAARA